MSTPPRAEIDAESPVAAVAAFDVATAETSDHLKELAEAMSRHHVGALLVRTHDDQIAILTERDIVQAVAEDNDAWAVDCITRDVITCDATVSIADAAETMLTAGVRHLVVTRSDGALGIASIRDLLRPLLDSVD